MSPFTWLEIVGGAWLAFALVAVISGWPCRSAMHHPRDHSWRKS